MPRLRREPPRTTNEEPFENTAPPRHGSTAVFYPRLVAAAADQRVPIISTPNSISEGGFFRAKMVFPKDYPNNPPSVRFVSEMWHPNVYADGKVCISILHLSLIHI